MGDRSELDQALAPALADLDRRHPGLLRVEPRTDGVWLWDSTNSGTGISLVEVDDDLPASIYAVTDKVQEAAVEALWGERKSVVWPVCPEHPDGHPLRVELDEDVWWSCPQSGRRIAIVGRLETDG